MPKDLWTKVYNVLLYNHKIYFIVAYLMMDAALAASVAWYMM